MTASNWAIPGVDTLAAQITKPFPPPGRSVGGDGGGEGGEGGGDGGGGVVPSFWAKSSNVSVLRRCVGARDHRNEEHRLTFLTIFTVFMPPIMSSCPKNLSK